MAPEGQKIGKRCQTIYRLQNGSCGPSWDVRDLFVCFDVDGLCCDLTEDDDMSDESVRYGTDMRHMVLVMELSSLPMGQLSESTYEESSYYLPPR